MSNTIVYEDGTAFHPGSYLEDLLDDWQMTRPSSPTNWGNPWKPWISSWLEKFRWIWNWPANWKKPQKSAPPPG